MGGCSFNIIKRLKGVGLITGSVLINYSDYPEGLTLIVQFLVMFIGLRIFSIVGG